VQSSSPVLLKSPFPVLLTGKISERSRFSSDFTLGALAGITVWHDYICPWCWVGWIHAERLKKEYGVSIDWRGAELLPEGYVSKPSKVPAPKAPAGPSRFDLFLEAEGIELATPRPKFVRSHNALIGAEAALIHLGIEAQAAYHEAVYRAYWERHADISKVEVLVKLAKAAGLDSEPIADSILMDRYEAHVLPFDDGAYSAGIRHVPTFLFGGADRLAEANYTDLARATERFLVRREKFFPV